MGSSGTIHSSIHRNAYEPLFHGLRLKQCPEPLLQLQVPRVVLFGRDVELDAPEPASAPDVENERCGGA